MGRRREELVARIGSHPRNAAGQHVGQRGEVGHRRRLRTVKRILDRGSPATRFKIDEVRNVPSGDMKA